MRSDDVKMSGKRAWLLTCLVAASIGEGSGCRPDAGAPDETESAVTSAASSEEVSPVEASAEPGVDSRHATESEPMAEGSSPVLEANLPPGDGAIDVRDAEPDELRAVSAAIGCPDDAYLPLIGCAECPTGMWEGESSETHIDVVVGRFVAEAERSAIATVRHCSDRAAGENLDVLLVEEEGAWRVVRQSETGWNDTRTCVFPHGADGVHIPLCATTSGSGGCYDTEVGVIFDDESSGTRVFQLPLELADCANNVVEWSSVLDRNGDGQEDVQTIVNEQSGWMMHDGNAFVWQEE